MTGGARRVEISAAFATAMDSPDQIATAERLGYDRAWLYDTPQQSPDVWMTLGLAAQRTSRIGLGPGVLVPSLRHPMVNAAAVATLTALAPGRVSVAFGTGFTATGAMGARPVTWLQTRRYVAAFRGLLCGETVDWEGARIRMLHPAGSSPVRPIDVPILIAAVGPKGRDVAHDLGDGIYLVGEITTGAHDFEWAALIVHGTVLGVDESLDSARVRAAAGPGHAVAYHGAFYRGQSVDLPGAAEWLAVVHQAEERERHLSVHDHHLVAMNAADEAAWLAGGWRAVPQTTLTGTPDQLRPRLRRLVDEGVTELVYQPAGPDIEGELAAFMEVAAPLRATVRPPSA